MSPSLVSQFRGSHWYGVGKSKLTLGPWQGGLNKVAWPQFVRPDELQECINYLIKEDGTLVGRPSTEVYGTATGLGTGTNPVAHLIGQIGPLATDPNVYPISSVDNGANTSFYEYGVSGDSWSAIFAASATGMQASDLVYYNNAYYVAGTDSSGNARLYRAPDTSSAFAVVAGFTTVSPGTRKNFVGTRVLKDRLLYVSNDQVFWSKATDPTVWAAPDGGYVNIQEDINAITLYQDALYIFGKAGIWRFSWSSDPSIDGVLERVSTAGAYGGVVYDNQLYVASYKGVHVFNNGYMTSISDKITNFYLLAASTGVDAYMGISLVGHFLIVGSLGAVGKRRGPISPVYQYGHSGENYLVYNLKTGTWVQWQFNAGWPGSTLPISSGPVSNSLIVGSTQGNLTPLKYFWNGNSFNTGGSINSVYSINASELENGNTVNVDYDATGAAWWIGQALKTAEVDLGDGNKFKRIFSSILEAVYTSVIFSVGSSALNLLLDGTPTTLTPPDTARLAWGKSFRAKRVGFSYDSITGTKVDSSGSYGKPEIGSVVRFSVEIREAREVTT